MTPEAREAKLASVDAEMVALYREQTQQSERIVRIFLCQDVEPPTRRQWMSRGVLAAEDKLIEPFRYQLSDDEADF